MARRNVSNEISLPLRGIAADLPPYGLTLSLSSPMYDTAREYMWLLGALYFSEHNHRMTPTLHFRALHLDYSALFVWPLLAVMAGRVMGIMSRRQHLPTTSDQAIYALIALIRAYSLYSLQWSACIHKGTCIRQEDHSYQLAATSYCTRALLLTEKLWMRHCKITLADLHLLWPYMITSATILE